LGTTSGDEQVTATSPTTTRSFTPPQLAQRWGVSPDRIRAMVRSGRLKGFNIAEPGERPQFRITPEVVEQFEAGVVVKPKSKTPPRRRVGSVESFV
jgi:hypothetical protein